MNLYSALLHLSLKHFKYCSSATRDHVSSATHTRTIPAFIPQLQGIITTLWLVLMCLPMKEWPGCVDLGGWSHTKINVPHQHAGSSIKPACNRNMENSNWTYRTTQLLQQLAIHTSI